MTRQVLLISDTPSVFKNASAAFAPLRVLMRDDALVAAQRAQTAAAGGLRARLGQRADTAPWQELQRPGNVVGSEMPNDAASAPRRPRPSRPPRVPPTPRANDVLLRKRPRNSIRRRLRAAPLTELLRRGRNTSAEAELAFARATDFLTDALLMAECDGLVGKFSSNLARLGYSLMSSREGCAQTLGRPTLTPCGTRMPRVSVSQRQHAQSLSGLTDELRAQHPREAGVTVCARTCRLTFLGALG